MRLERTLTRGCERAKVPPSSWKPQDNLLDRMLGKELCVLMWLPSTLAKSSWMPSARSGLHCVPKSVVVAVRHDAQPSRRVLRRTEAGMAQGALLRLVRHRCR
jgi:hypothetical protein